MSLLFTVMGTAVDSELSPGCDRTQDIPSSRPCSSGEQPVVGAEFLFIGAAS